MKMFWFVLMALVILIFIFSLTSCAADTFMWGDLNTDTKVDVSDAVKLAQFLATWAIGFTDNEKKAADVYRDGAVDAKDAVLLAQYLADWDVTLGAVPPGAMKNVISAAENGIVMNDPSAASTNSSKINSLIKKAAESTEITFPSGTCYISGGITVSGKKQLRLKGDDTKLVNTSYDPKKASYLSYQTSKIFELNGSTDVTLDGFTIDYKAHTTADGIIKKKQDGKTYFQVYEEFVTGDKTPLSGGEKGFAVEFFDSYGTVKTDETYFSAPTPIEKIDERTFAIEGSYGYVGDQISVRFTSGTYASPAVYITNMKNLTVKDFTVNSCPSAIFYAPVGSENFTFENLTVKPADGSKALFGTNVDSIHIKGLRGTLNVIDCTFIGLGDDALNVHSRVAPVSAIKGNEITAKDAFQSSNLDASWAKTGDTILFYKNYKEIGTATVKSFSGSKLVLESVPSGVGTDCVMQNLAYSPVVKIKGCTVERGRARGFLFQTKNVTVENCSFKNLRLPGILVAPDFTQWYEGGFCDNIAITGCSFEKCMLCEWLSGKGAITVNDSHDFKDPHPVPSGVRPHKNVTVTGNTFKDCKSYAVYAYGAEKVKFENNTVTGCTGTTLLSNSGT